MNVRITKDEFMAYMANDEAAAKSMMDLKSSL